MIKTLKKFGSLIKISHSIFALPFALIGFFVGIKDSQINNNYLILFLKIIGCTFFARTAAMSFNRLIDEKIDGLNPRTKNREIPSGVISKKAVFVITVLSCLIFILLTYTINIKCFYLSFIALIIVLGYSYTKRFTFLCHLILGIGLGIAPVGAYIATTSTISISLILLGFTVMFWVSGFDIIYAFQDLHFDKTQKLHSIPSFFGEKFSKILSFTFHLISIVFLMIIGKIENYSIIYFIGVLIFTLLVLYQHYIFNKYGLKKIDIAFFTLNGYASILLMICWGVEIFW